MRSALSLSIAVLFLGLSLFGCSRQSEESRPVSTGEVDPFLNSQERMEERDNNSSVIIESGKANEWDGQDKQEGRSPREVEALEQGDRRRLNN